MANYYVKNSGSDSNTGLSDAQAWKTLNKVNSSSFLANDNIYLNRGDTWREQLYPSGGTSSGRLTIGAYGSGNKPRIVPAAQSTSTGDWTSMGGNIWRYRATSFNALDCANLIFGTTGLETGIGYKEKTYADLDTNGDFWWDNSGTGFVYVYADANPVTKWGTVHLSITIHAVEMHESHYLTIENIDVRYAGLDAFFMSNCNDVTVQYCDCRYIGGGDYQKTYVERIGNAFEVNNTGSNILITHNTAYQVFEVGVDVESIAESVVHDNIVASYNDFDYVETVFALADQKASSSMSDVTFEHNTARHAGEGYWTAMGNKWNVGSLSRYFWMWATDATLSNINVRYNDFYGGSDSDDYYGSGYLGFYREEDIAKVNIDYNTYHTDDMKSNQFAYVYYPYPAVVYTISDFSDWKTDTGQDAHSTMQSATDDTATISAPATITVEVLTPTINYSYTLDAVSLQELAISVHEPTLEISTEDNMYADAIMAELSLGLLDPTVELVANTSGPRYGIECGEFVLVKVHSGGGIN